MLTEVYEGNEPFAFISYAHTDKDRVFPILEKLSQLHLRLWYDGGIEGGVDWADDIATRLLDCHCVLAFISGNYIASNNCRDEITYAIDLNKEWILIYLEQTTLSPGMTMRLSRKQKIFMEQYGETEFYKKILKAPAIQFCRSEAVNKTKKIFYTNGYYEGEVLDRKRNGKGEMKYTNGAVYDGDWLDDYRHGHGVMTYTDGGSYDGEWVKGRFHGSGTRVYKDKSVYKGTFSEGKRHGNGTLTDADGTVICAGVWKKDSFIG